MSAFKVLAISGATHPWSTCKNLIKYISAIDQKCSIKLFEIIDLPHFVPGIDDAELSQVVKDFRSEIEEADAVIIVTPEYIYSLPAILKNAIEWTVSTTVFDQKPVGYIVAAPTGEKAFESIDLILHTIQAKLNEDCKLLLKGLKGKTTDAGLVNDAEIASEIDNFYFSLMTSITETSKGY